MHFIISTRIRSLEFFVSRRPLWTHLSTRGLDHNIDGANCTVVLADKAVVQARSSLFLHSLEQGSEHFRQSACGICPALAVHLSNTRIMSQDATYARGSKKICPVALVRTIRRPARTMLVAPAGMGYWRKNGACKTRAVDLRMVKASKGERRYPQTAILT